MSENLEKICMWKVLIGSPNSTSGEDMRESNGKARKCIDCDGSREYAEKIECKCYVVNYKNGR